MKTQVKWLVLSILGVLAACSPTGQVSKPSMEHPMEQWVASAKTRADHEALAAHYEQEAQMLQQKAEEHRKSAQTYSGSVYGGKLGAVAASHCLALARNYQRAAEENLELAKLHRQMAAEAQP